MIVGSGKNGYSLQIFVARMKDTVANGYFGYCVGNHCYVNIMSTTSLLIPNVGIFHPVSAQALQIQVQNTEALVCLPLWYIIGRN